MNCVIRATQTEIRDPQELVNIENGCPRAGVWWGWGSDSSEEKEGEYKVIKRKENIVQIRNRKINQYNQNIQ